MVRQTRGVGILGATGYTGMELIRLLGDHPRARILGISARQSAGLPAAQVIRCMPQLQLTLEAESDDTPREWRERGVDTVFACLPHGAFAARAAAWLQEGVRVVDLSADFRLRQASAYPMHYAMTHPAPELLSHATYGLCEWCEADMQSVRLLANPGCYATAILLAALPAARAGWVAEAPIVVNAISGVSGAGRGLRADTQFGECQGSVAPYKVGEQHGHLGEIKQALAALGCHAPVLFNPHLAPMARGISASLTIALPETLEVETVRAHYAQVYKDCPFVQVLSGDALPQTAFVRGSNRCDVAVQVVASGRVLQVFAAIDNLLKGAAGQAVQNFNRMGGDDETLGLSVGAVPCI